MYDTPNRQQGYCLQFVSKMLVACQVMVRGPLSAALLKDFERPGGLGTRTRNRRNGTSLPATLAPATQPRSWAEGSEAPGLCRICISSHDGGGCGHCALVRAPLQRAGLPAAALP